MCESNPKKCEICGKDLPKPKRKTCSESCAKEKQVINRKKHYQDHKEEYKTYSNEWRKKNSKRYREYYRDYHRKYKRKSYKESQKYKDCQRIMDFVNKNKV